MRYRSRGVEYFQDFEDCETGEDVRKTFGRELEDCCRKIIIKTVKKYEKNI